jgi:hypothetical protein
VYVPELQNSYKITKIYCAKNEFNTSFEVQNIGKYSVFEQSVSHPFFSNQGYIFLWDVND